jgi:hypothetical protein
VLFHLFTGIGRRKIDRSHNFAFTPFQEFSLLTYVDGPGIEGMIFV